MNERVWCSAAGARGRPGAPRFCAAAARRSRPWLAPRTLGLALLAILTACVASPEPTISVEEQAEAATRAHEWPRAAELWHEIHLAAGGHDKRALYETARALYLSGDAPSACVLLRMGLDVFPSDVELLELSGLIQRECGFRRAAEDTYSQVIELDPDRLSALRALGELRMELGLERAACGPLLRHIALSGGDARTYTLLGDAERLTAQPLLAFQAYERAIAFGEVDLSTLILAAQLAFHPAVRSAVPDASERAGRWLELAVERDPQSTRAHRLQGRLAEEQRRPDAAVGHYRRAVETDPGDLVALTCLARLYAQLGDADRTSGMVTRALEIESDPARRAELMELLASVAR